MSRTMSIHRALVELKTLDQRIANASAALEPLGLYQKGRNINTPSGKIFVEAKLTEEANANYNAVVDLIKSKTSIKRAIVESNSKTTVTIGSRTMTVADAITEKSYIKLKKDFLSKLQLQQRQALAKLTQLNEAVEKGKETLLNASFSKESKPDAATIENVTKPYLETNTWHLADPLTIQDKINTLQNEIATFESEVDAILSESNAITIIVID